MTTEPTYEYRVVDKNGEPPWMGGEVYFTTTDDARYEASESNRLLPMRTPHRIQRRLITPWEDINE